MIKKEITQKYRINESIPNWYKLVRIIGDGIESKIVTLDNAKEIAEKMELDLIEINSTTSPPILKIGNYEKMQYEAKKMAKKNAKQKQEIKEIKLSANIAEHDLLIKSNNAKKFIEKGNNVKVILTLRGREMSRQDENKKSLLQFITLMEDVSVPINMPKTIGNKTIVILKKK